MPPIYAPAVTSKLFDAFWAFAAERQAIFFRRLRNEAAPWTSDPILQRYKFTNTYRAADRVSQYLIQKVIYQGDQTPGEVIFRTLLFKLFNKVSTWEALVAAHGFPTIQAYNLNRYCRTLDDLQQRGQPIYGAAYIMPPADPPRPKYRGHLLLLQRMLDDGLPARVVKLSSLEDIYRSLRSYPHLGPFLAFQYAIDVAYGPGIEASEDSFVVAGPGALRGLRKCFLTFGGLSAAHLIHRVTQHQAEEFSIRGLRFETLWGRPLQPVDVQNIFCEFDKYTRGFGSNIAGPSRKRIKQKYQPSQVLTLPWFPPKWFLNEKISNQPLGLLA